MAAASSLIAYPATLAIDYSAEPRNRLSTFLRLIYVLPILLVLQLLNSVITFPLVLMILFRRKYPRWWFEFNREYVRFSTRVWAYCALLTDQYPSTDEEQSVHVELLYPDAGTELNRWLPLVKWILAIPHYIVLLVLGVAAFAVTVIAWFAILFTGKYPAGMHGFIVGVFRWGLRVEAYVFVLITDRYPPFSLEA